MKKEQFGKGVVSKGTLDEIVVSTDQRWAVGKKPGDEIELAPGLSARVLEDEQIHAAAANGMVYVCGGVLMIDRKNVLPGARSDMKCEDCKEHVWISPATYRLWKINGAPILCIPCAIRRQHAEGQDS